MGQRDGGPDAAEGKGGEDESRRWERRRWGMWEGGRGEEGERGGYVYNIIRNA